MTERLLLKHVGSLGDHLFLVGALLEGIARRRPDAEVTLVTAWGYKDRRGHWGKRNQDGYCITLMKENPHINQLVHWSDENLSLAGRICAEEGRHFPTWNRAHFERIRADYHTAVELEFGLSAEENPLERIAAATGLVDTRLGPYPFYATDADWAVGRAVAERLPHPRVALLEGLNGTTMRGWDPVKVQVLEHALSRTLRTPPIWWGEANTPLHHGRRLTLRENIAFLGALDLAIGVMGAPMHFAAAAGVQTICLFGGQSYNRVAPGYFLNPYVPDSTRHHLTIFGPTCDEPCLLKREIPCKNLHGEDRTTTGFKSWREIGRQSDKSCVATIPVEQVLAAAAQALQRRGLL